MSTQPNPQNTHLVLLLLLVLIQLWILKAQSKCRPKYGCNLALASYYVVQQQGTTNNLSHISDLFGLQIPQILKYNPNLQIPNPNPNTTLPSQIRRIRIPFKCDCLNGDFLGHTFAYTARPGDTYAAVARRDFADLTTGEWLSKMNLLDPNDIPEGVTINVTVNCSCGDPRVSTEYGLFLTYPIRNGEGLTEVAAESGLPAEVIRRYNRGSNFSGGLVFVPAKGLFVV